MNMIEAKTFVDFLKSLYSRKLMVFVVATILLLTNKLTSDIWTYIAIAYMGTNVLQSFLDPARKKVVELAPGTKEDQT